MIRLVLLILLLPLHLGARDRRKGSHLQKTHGSWSPNNPFYSKRRSLDRLNSRFKKTRQASIGHKIIQVKQVEATKERARDKAASIERFITVPPGGGTRLNATRDTLKTISNVHDVSNLTPISITTKKTKKGVNGSFIHDVNRNRPKGINVASTNRPQTTVVHEIGHYLDYDGLDEKGGFSSKSGGSETKGIMTAISHSSTSNKILEMLNNPEKFAKKEKYTLFDGSNIEYSTNPSKNYLLYLNRPEELFARAYAQYITQKRGNSKMKQEMDEFIKESHSAPSSYPWQWKPDEFAPIAKEFDKMFKSKGWLKDG